LSVKNIFTFDHVLPSWLEESGENQFYRFPVEYNHHTKDENPPFFGKCLFNKKTGVYIQPPYFVDALCDYIRYDLVKKIDPKATFFEFERVIVNGQTGGMSPGRHPDYDDFNIWTAVYFIVGNSGDLVFYINNDTKKIKFRKHRLVVFNSSIEHEALAPDMGDWRMSIGINWYMDTKFNLQTKGKQ